MNFTLPKYWDRTIQALIVLMVVMSIYVYIIHFETIYSPILNFSGFETWQQKWIVRPGILWAFIGLLLLLFRTLLWFTYRTHAAAGVEDAPALTVIIPAYNEGEMVGKSIESVAAADYPAGRLEIFVVDDGSKDDTWEHITQAAARYPELVTAVRLPENRGKRAALAEGFRKAKGEIVVTIDSDSVIDRNTLFAVVGPFRNPRIGAVAGRVDVYNRNEGMIPRMLHVRYALTFDFLRAVQSTYGTVYCCPGALAAYRVSVVRRVLSSWMEQKFLGASCTTGEDRAMTNYILAENYDTVYQRSAVVHTIVPVSYDKLCKMFLRWDRSYIREEIRLWFILSKRPLLSGMVTALDTMVTNVAYFLGYASLVMLVEYFIQDHSILPRILAAIGVTAGLNMLYFLRMERSWNFLYGILYSYYSFFLMFWILPYAALTVRSRSWLTR